MVGQITGREFKWAEQVLETLRLGTYRSSFVRSLPRFPILPGLSTEKPVVYAFVLYEKEGEFKSAFFWFFIY